LLLGLAQLERGNAQLGQRQRGFRGLSLDLATQELVADLLDLLADVELGGIEVDQFPGEPEDFTLAQAQDQDQYESGVKRLLVVSSGFEELAGFIDTPAAALVRGGVRNPV
jgi:hypothetical protein